MNFDWLSFLLGLITSSAVGWLLLWSEKYSLANRIAHNCCEHAREIISFEFARYKITNPDADDFEEWNIYPIENDDFIIKELPELRQQSDVHIEEYLGVYSKIHNTWFLIQEMYDCENVTRKYWYYLCDSNFNQGKMIKTPHDFDIGKYLT
jgi:hypothetical protein